MKYAVRKILSLSPLLLAMSLSAENMITGLGAGSLDRGHDSPLVKVVTGGNGLTSSTSVGAIGAIVGSMSSINPSVVNTVESVVNMINDSDNLFESFDGGGDEGSSAIAGCTDGGGDLKNPNRGADDGSSLSGLCETKGYNGGTTGKGSHVSCPGVDFSTTGGVSVKLSGLCGQDEATDQANEEENNETNGTTGGFDKSQCGTIVSIFDPRCSSGAGGGGAGGGHTPTPKTIDPVTSLQSNVCDVDELDSLTAKKKKKIDDVQCSKKGLRGKELYRTDGGAIAKKAKSKPSSSTGVAYSNIDVPTLFLKQYALKVLGTDDERALSLPKTPADAIESMDGAAMFEASKRINHYDLENKIIKKLTPKFAAISASSIKEYEKKEKQEFDKWRKNDKDLKKAYKTSVASVKMRYSHWFALQNKKPSFIFDVSEEMAKKISLKNQNAFRFSALMQMEEGTQMRAKIAREIQRNKELIDISVQRAYAAASMFRQDIAKKEIDDMLKAIDTSIK